MARKLVSDWVKVATSGHTIDGRVISEQEIQDMAETYDPEEYTANIWYEHIRLFGNLGRVNEVKAERDAKNRLCLFAKICPTDELIYLNSRGQKLFTSIEIRPNFAETGKSYLRGLAVTDSPASLGTSELQFSRLEEKADLISEPVEIESITFSVEDQSLISRFLEKFTSTKPEPKQEDDMTPEQLKAITDAINAQAENIKLFNTQLASIAEKLTPKEPKDQPQPTAPASDSVSAKEFGELMTSFTELKGNLEQLETKFNEALTKPTGATPTGELAGDPAHVEVI